MNAATKNRDKQGRKGLLGRKVGMTQVFDANGAAVPVTVIEAGPCPVMMVRSPERDGYAAVQIGFLDKPRRLASKSVRGQVAKLDSRRAKRRAEGGVAVVAKADCEPKRFVVAAPTNHPLADRKQIRVEDLSGATLLLLEDGHCLRDQALDVCNRIDAEEKQDFRATSIETLRQMVAAGAGVTLLPELATRGSHAAPRGLVLRPFVKPQPSRRIGAIWRKSSARQAAIQMVSDVIAEQLA